MKNPSISYRRSLPTLLVTGLLVGLLAGLLAGCGGAGGDGLALPVPTQTDPDSLRETKLGKVIGGKTQDGAFAWRGIPFAAPGGGSALAGSEASHSLGRHARSPGPPPFVRPVPGL